jgi:hypothetical protein
MALLIIIRFQRRHPLMRRSQVTNRLAKRNRYSLKTACKELSHKVTLHRSWISNNRIFLNRTLMLGVRNDHLIQCLATYRRQPLNFQAVALCLRNLWVWLSLISRSSWTHRRKRTRRLTTQMRQEPKKTPIISNLILLFCMRMCLYTEAKIIGLSLWIKISNLVLMSCTSSWSTILSRQNKFTGCSIDTWM